MPEGVDTSLVDAEIEKYDWRKLRTLKGDASNIPAAVRALVLAEEKEDAEAAYWRIDNVALIQGRLSESVAPLTSCLVVGLPYSRRFGRSYTLDLLASIAGGYDDHVDIREVGPVSAVDCVRRMVVQVPFYAKELHRSGNPSCVDILLMCGIYLEEVKPRVVEILKGALQSQSCRGVTDLIESALVDLS